MSIATPSDWSVVVVGSGGAGSETKRAHPSLLLRVSTGRALVDAGDGTLRQLAPYNPRVLDFLVVTAAVTDRLAGLPALLDQPPAHGRRRLPVLIGPPGIVKFVESMAAFMSDEPQVTDIVEVDDEAAFSLKDAKMHVATVDEGAKGRVLGVQLSEAARTGRFDLEAAGRLGVQPGPEFSRLQTGETVRGIRLEQVLGPPRPGRRLSALGPCRPTDEARKLSAASRLLLAVTPYISEKQDLAVESNVMTGVEAAQLATQARVEALALLHVAPSMPGMSYARREAAQFHHPVYLPGDGDEFSIPLPDNGPVGHRRTTTAG